MRITVVSVTVVRGSMNASTPRRVRANSSRCSRSSRYLARAPPPGCLRRNNATNHPPPRAPPLLADCGKGTTETPREPTPAGWRLAVPRPSPRGSAHLTSQQPVVSDKIGRGNPTGPGRETTVIESTEFDVVVLGGGSGGYATALRAAELDLSVALIEKDKLGGTCLHRGCIPTKALLHAGEVADAAREAEQFGVNATFNGIDMKSVNAYKDGVVSRLYKGLQGLVKSRKITYIEGTGKLVAPTTVEVDGSRYTGRNLVLATGSYAKTLPGLDIDGKRGITFKVNKPFEGIARTETGVRVTVSGGESVEAELALVAVSRGPSTADLGYEEQGIKLDRGFVPTDDRLRTSVPNVYAVGDIVPGMQLAHRGFQQGIFVAEEIAGLNPPVIDEAGIPRVTYCEPEVASMGLNEAKAREQYDDKITTFTYDLAGNGKSQILKTQGFVKLVRVADGPVV